MNLEQEAREWLEANTKVRWATEPEYGVTPDELNRRPAKYASWLAGFARQQVEAEREREADWLSARIKGDEAGAWVTLSRTATIAHINELRGEGE